MTGHCRHWYTLSADECAAIDRARLVLLAHEVTIEQAIVADTANDLAELRRLAPLMVPVVAAVDTVWAIIWPELDPATITPGARVALFTNYLAAAHADRQQRLIAPPSAPPAA